MVVTNGALYGECLLGSGSRPALEPVVLCTAGAWTEWEVTPGWPRLCRGGCHFLLQLLNRSGLGIHQEVNAT